MNKYNPVYIRSVKNNILAIAINYMVPPLYITDIDIDKLKTVWERYEILLKMILESSTIESLIDEIKEYDFFLSKHIGSNLWINYFDYNKVSDLISTVKELVEKEESKNSIFSKVYTNALGILSKPFIKNPVLTKSIIPSYNYFNEAYNFCEKNGINGLSVGLSEPYNENCFYDLDVLFEKLKEHTGYEKKQIGLNKTLNLRINNTEDFNIKKSGFSEQYQSLGYFVADKSNSNITGDLTLMIRSLNDYDRILEVLIHEHTHAMDFYIGKKIGGELFSSLDEKTMSKYPNIKNEYRNILFSAYNFEDKENLSEQESEKIYNKIIESLIVKMFSPFYDKISYELMEIKHNSMYLFGDIKDRFLGKVSDEESYKNLKVLFNQPTQMIDGIILKHIIEIKTILFSSDMKLKCFYPSPTNHAERGFESPPIYYNYYLSLEERLANAVALGILNNNNKVKESLKKIWEEINNINQ